MSKPIYIEKEVTVKLTGIKAVEYLIDKHDWNIYGSDYDRLSVIAYRQSLDEAGNIHAVYSWETIFTLPLRIENNDILRVLLGKDWVSQVWYESDEWSTVNEFGDNIILNAYLCDEAFRNWFDINIQDYEMTNNH